MAALDHPNVVPLYEAGEEDGTVFIATRWVDGTELGDADPARRPAASPARAARIAAQIASALEVAHEKGLVHRDVKPSNVIVTSEDHVYLTDFGLTKRAGVGVGLHGRRADAGHDRLRGAGADRGQRGRCRAATSTGSPACSTRCWSAPPRSRARAAGWRRCGPTSTPSRPRCASSGRTCPRRWTTVIRRGLAKRPDDRPTAAAFGGRGAARPSGEGALASRRSSGVRASEHDAPQRDPGGAVVGRRALVERLGGVEQLLVAGRRVAGGLRPPRRPRRAPRGAGVLPGRLARQVVLDRDVGGLPPLEGGPRPGGDPPPGRVRDPRRSARACARRRSRRAACARSGRARRSAPACRPRCSAQSGGRLPSFGISRSVTERAARGQAAPAAVAGRRRRAPRTWRARSSSG